MTAKTPKAPALRLRVRRFLNFLEEVIGPVGKVKTTDHHLDSHAKIHIWRRDYPAGLHPIKRKRVSVLWRSDLQKTYPIQIVLRRTRERGKKCAFGNAEEGISANWSPLLHEHLLVA